MSIQVAGGAAAALLPSGHGRGPGGQPMTRLRPVSRCPVTGCGSQIDPTRLMCRAHWYLVPKRLRDTVWATWRSGSGAQSAEHQELVLTAIAASQEEEGAAATEAAARSALG